MAGNCLGVSRAGGYITAILDPKELENDVVFWKETAEKLRLRVFAFRSREQLLKELLSPDTTKERAAAICRDLYLPMPAWYEKKKVDKQKKV